MQSYTCYFSYDNVEDLCVVKAATEEEAIANAQQMLNKHPEFADVQVIVHSASAD